ncbi:hypothetical protein AB0F77_17060 [Streptomyces sp. NPDC026672]|uniref:hypothetical protein n=1 Tax=unclassified Streptomyces TaxID=2593676 RepID=UPI0033D341A7
MYGMGYYDGNEYDADEYEEFEEAPPQQQRNAPRSPGLRAHVKAITAENVALKRELESQKAMLQELMEGDAPQISQSPYPNSRLTPEEIMQYQRMQSMGAVGAAPPAGTQEEQIRQIRAAKSPEELTQYLRSQGSMTGMNYTGVGY